MKNLVRATMMYGVMAALAACAATANAQNYTSPYFNIAIANATPPGIVVRRRVVPPTREQQLAYERAVQAQRERGRLMISKGRVSTTFQPTGSYLTPKPLAASYMPEGPGRQDLEQIYVRYIQYYERVVRGMGKPTNDVAVALSDLISAARQVCYDSGPLSEEQFASLVTQLRQFLEKNELFAGRNNIEKQQVHEEMAIGWADAGEYYVRARQTGDQALLERVRQSARQAVDYYTGGMSLDDIRVEHTSVKLPVK